MRAAVSHSEQTVPDGPSFGPRAAEILRENLDSVRGSTDRMFAGLLAVEWVVGMLAAWLISPLAWAGSVSSPHVHLWGAGLLGGVIVSLPCVLALSWPGRAVTRHAVAVAQMLMAALFIHLTGGRIETHFHVFGSLALLAFYRDTRVLLTAALVVGADHFLRGVYWPQSVFGTLTPSHFRWLEHLGWILFVLAFLWRACRSQLAEMRRQARQQAELEELQRDTAEEVRRRTRDLSHANELLELVVCGSSDGVWDWNLADDRCYFSERFLELLGYSLEERESFPARLDSLESRTHPDDAPALARALHHQARNGEPLDLVCRFKLRQGGYRWFRLRGKRGPTDAGSAGRVAGLFSDVTHLKEVEEELVRAARLDQLTGLPNRSLLLERVQHALCQARERGRKFAVMFLDFDRFKIINDSLGHDIGDALLCAIAERLRGELRFTDTVCREVEGPTAARMGGDEFVVLLDPIRSEDDLPAIAHRLLNALAQPYRLGPHEVFSTASIGIVTGSSDYARAEDVIRDADTAMYEAKRAGKGRFAVFDEAMRLRVQRHHSLENDLRRAIEGDQFWLAYQPIVSLETGDLKSVEALLRWNHPREGLISPAEFIPIAEESELILAIGDWVLRRGMRQMAEWIDRLGPAAPPTVSINLSRKQFALVDLPQRILQACEEAGLPPDRLQLEVTEDFFASDVQAAIAAMEEIKGLGIQLAIDDFGTGCSSFASLHQFPADVLKVDRSLLFGIEDSKETVALVHSLAILVRNLGMTLVAEGIEKESHVIILQDLGCQFGQGYYFARPLAPPDFETFALARADTAATVSGAASFERRWAELVQ